VHRLAAQRQQGDGHQRTCYADRPGKCFQVSGVVPEPWSAEWVRHKGRGNIDSGQVLRDIRLSSQRGGTIRTPNAAKCSGLCSGGEDRSHTCGVGFGVSAAGASAAELASVPAGDSSASARYSCGTSTSRPDCLREAGESTTCSTDERHRFHRTVRGMLPWDSGGALILACAYGDAKLAKECIAPCEALGTLDKQDQAGLRAAYFAVQSDSMACLELLIGTDTARQYNKSFFDTQITADGMTLLMYALRCGCRDIYEYLLDSFDVGGGCELFLAGAPSLGCEGKEASLDRWLDFLPEITRPEQVQRPRSVTLAHGGYGRSFENPSLEQFEEARRRRIRARCFVRSRIHGSNGSSGISPTDMPGRRRLRIHTPPRLPSSSESSPTSPPSPAEAPMPPDSLSPLGERAVSYADAGFNTTRPEDDYEA